MTGTGHLLTSGSLATAILYSAGIRDSHHFLPALAVALGAALLPDLDAGTSTISLAFGSGYTMHILADMTTRRGVRLWWPLSHRYFHLLPRRWRIRTERSLTPAECQTILFFTGLASLALFLPARWFVVCLATFIIGMHLVTLWADRRSQKKES